MNWFNRIHSEYKVLISLGLAILAYGSVLPAAMGQLSRVAISWDVFNFSLAALMWITMVTMKPGEIRKMASKEDQARFIVFIIVLLTTLASISVVILLLRNKQTDNMDKDIRNAVYIAGVLFSWILLHTIFAFRYAHLYYDDDDTIPEQEAGGLIIPGEKEPDYIDFAYFSFVIGMTFQVSDINITGRVIRRLVLLHGILSFLFNTVIVALTISIISTLAQ